ncbi:unnamed protein product [Prunus armeniaca]
MLKNWREWRVERLESSRGQRDVVGVVGEAERGGGRRAGSLEVGGDGVVWASIQRPLDKE